ncbi:sulfatase [Gracilibacillus sp. S3-1-1]|uniref:Sulfatase n=1 Tax=Gracilibacillus pellucidus TaxID=3095368 RepID=A0ACC6M3D8_9BACI|nr:sulfatase [Gracilibacillus sp. S3-1-1]MDX8045398.1 sulfatase [Gracilibacillus sp. S3-1-1]
MKAIMVMFDSLNRNMLPNYGCDWLHAPNFKRLQEKTVTFDNCYAGSLPCMPARRELHTGRYNFLHRSWGPIEPFDDSMPELLKNNNVHSHLVTDHQHYWEDGGGTYHTRYSTFELIRGQEGDPWKGHVNESVNIETEVDHTRNPIMKQLFEQDQINREYYKEENAHPQSLTFKNGLEFIEKNHNENDWFLQLETFDPHEPFVSYEEYKDLYPHDYEGKHFDWPPYYFVQESEEVVEHGKMEYAALLSMCDRNLGKVLDMMDKYNMWEDTMLIVNTDHGYLLGEHGWWAKTVMPVYNEIANIPLFVWDPREKARNTRREALVQTIDLAPTLLEFFNVDIPETMQGKPLRGVIKEGEKIREAALFGHHGLHVNITDGDYVFMKGPATPENGPLYEYTLMPTHMRNMFSPSELHNMELTEPFDFMKNVTPLKIKAGKGLINPYQYGSKLYNLIEDPKQENEMQDMEVELRLTKALVKLMKENDAPMEQYERLGLDSAKELTIEDIKAYREREERSGELEELAEFDMKRSVRNQIIGLMNMTPSEERDQTLQALVSFLRQQNKTTILESDLYEFKQQHLQHMDDSMFDYFMGLVGRTN